MIDNEDGVEYHQELASGWDVRYRKGSFKKRADHFCSAILPLIPTGGNWLDAGCGSGYFSRILAERQSKVIGLDASENMILEARQLAKAAIIDARIDFDVVDTIEILPVVDAGLDGCLCLSVLEYVSNPNNCINEFARVIKPGGYMILSVPHRWSFLRFIQKTVRRFNGAGKATALNYLVSSQYSATPKELTNVLAKCNMEVVKFSNFDAIIPDVFHTLLPPSLIFLVARKSLHD